MLVNQQQYRRMLEEYFHMYPETYEPYMDYIRPYNFSNAIPKWQLYVKLADNITAERSEFVGNGIRTYFKDDLNMLIDNRRLMDGFRTAFTIFGYYNMLIALITLVLSFFLLLIQTTQNIK
jgi:hypothetical protein